MSQQLNQIIHRDIPLHSQKSQFWTGTHETEAIFLHPIKSGEEIAILDMENNNNKIRETDDKNVYISSVYMFAKYTSNER